MQELKTKIFQEIEENKLKPKPKWLFAFKSFGLLVFILLVILFSFYVLAFLGFVLSERDWVQDNTYSLQGIYFFLNTLPVSMIFLAGFMILTASFIAYKYGLSYRKPFINTLIVIVFVLFGSRYIFAKSGLQQYIKEEAFSRNIQLVPTTWKKLRDGVKSAQMK